MYESVLESIICNTFEKFIGRFQDAPVIDSDKTLKTGQVQNKPKKAMEIRFDLAVDHEKEEGYRHLVVRIYAPGNYVGVLTKEEWDVIPVEDLEWNEKDEDFCVKKGKDYVKGESDWNRESYHDSGWRSDGIHSLLWKNRGRITHINTLCMDGDWDWYKIIEMTEIELAKFEKAIGR